MNILLFFILSILKTNSQSVKEYIFNRPNSQEIQQQQNQTALFLINSNSSNIQINQTNEQNEINQKEQEKAALDEQLKKEKKEKLDYAKNISILIQADQDQINQLQEEIQLNQNLGQTEVFKINLAKVTEIMKEEETLKKHLREQKKLYSKAIYESNHQNLLEKNNLIKEKKLQQQNITLNQTINSQKSLELSSQNQFMNISSIHTNISNTNEKSLNATDNSTFRINFNLTKEQKLLRKRLENQEKRINETKAFEQEENERAIKLFEQQLEAKLKARWEKQELEYQNQQVMSQNPQQTNGYQDGQQYSLQDPKQIQNNQQYQIPQYTFFQDQNLKDNMSPPNQKHLNQFNDIDHLAQPSLLVQSKQVPIQPYQRRLHTMVSFLEAPYYTPQSQDEIDRQKKMQGKQTTNLKSPFQAVSKIVTQEKLNGQSQQQLQLPLQEKEKEVVPEIHEKPKQHFETQEIQIDQNDPSVYEKRTNIKVNLMRMPYHSQIEQTTDGDKWMAEQASKNPLNHPLIIESTKQDDDQDMLQGGMPLELSQNKDLMQKQLREQKIQKAQEQMHPKEENLSVKNNTEISQVNYDKVEINEDAIGGYSTVIMPNFSPALLKNKNQNKKDEPQETMYSDEQIKQIRSEQIKEQNELNLQHDMSPSIIV